jgi:hypothetical protein
VKAAKGLDAPRVVAWAPTHTETRAPREEGMAKTVMMVLMTVLVVVVSPVPDVRAAPASSHLCRWEQMTDRMGAEDRQDGSRGGNEKQRVRRVNKYRRVFSGSHPHLALRLQDPWRA